MEFLVWLIKLSIKNMPLNMAAVVAASADKVAVVEGEATQVQVDM